MPFTAYRQDSRHGQSRQDGWPVRSSGRPAGSWHAQPASRRRPAGRGAGQRGIAGRSSLQLV